MSTQAKWTIFAGLMALAFMVLLMMTTGCAATKVYRDCEVLSENPKLWKDCKEMR